MKCYVIDAFTHAPFKGNPAAVCPVDSFPSDRLMQSIAMENNLSETAFLVKNGSDYDLRWFTPGGEIDLCGHATLATAYAVFRFLEPERQQVSFHTQSGLLTVTRKGDLLEMALPAYALTPVPVTDQMEQAMGVRPREAWMGRDLLCVLDSADEVRALQPDLEAVAALPGLLLQVTAPGEGEFDCVSRTFGPKLGLVEDPVCGSGHCHIVPLWAEKLGKAALVAFQASPRTGVLHCRKEGDKVYLAGPAALYSIAELQI